MRPPSPVVLFAVATASYVANVGLGSAATRGLVHARFRWTHHALYVSTCLLAGAATSSLLWSGSRAGWRLLPAVVPLVVLARVPARSRQHPVVALSAAPFFVASVVRALQEHRGLS